MRVQCLLLAGANACLALSSAPPLNNLSIVSTNQSVAISYPASPVLTDPTQGTRTPHVIEERSILDHVRDLLSSAAVRLDIEPELLFDLLHAGTGEGDLSKHTRLVLWLQYVGKLLTKRGPDRFLVTEIYALLSETYTDAQLAALFEKLRYDVVTHDLAERMLALMLSTPIKSPGTHGTWPDPDATLQQVFKELRLEDANLVDNILFAGWIRYAISNRERGARRHRDPVIDNENFYFQVYTLLRQTKSVEELPKVLDRLPFVPSLERTYQELERVANWEKEKHFYLREKEPPTPQQLMDAKKVPIGMNVDFFQWLRYCDAYKTVATRRHDDEYLGTLVDFLAKATSLRELVSLFHSIRDATGLTTLADELKAVSLAKLVINKA